MRSCGKRRFASGSRREPQDVLLRGPPPLPKAALLTPSSAWNEGCGSHIHREAPACSCQALPAKGLWCWKPGIGWLSAPGQLFARILDINPSRRFCTWCFHVAANVPLSISQSAAFLVPCPLCPVPPVSQEHHHYSWLISLGVLPRASMRVGHPGEVEGAWGRNLNSWSKFLHLSHQETLGRAWAFCEPHFSHPSNGTPHLSPSCLGELWEGMRTSRCFINSRC